MTHTRSIRSVFFLMIFAFMAMAAVERRGLVAAQNDSKKDLAASATQKLDAGDFVGAEQGFRLLLASDPTKVDPYLGLASALVGQGRVQEASTLLSQAAERMLRIESYAEAERLFERAVEIDPGSSQVLAQLGRTRILNRRYLTAEPVLEQAYGLGQQDTQTLLYLSMALWENGRLDRAEEVLRQAITASDRGYMPLFYLGRLLAWQGRYHEAADLLGESTSQAPTAGDLQLELARALEGAGRTTDALAAYRRACDLLPEHYEARYGYAMLLLKVGQREAAQTELEEYRLLLQRDQARTTQSGLEQARIDQGRDLLRQGRIEEALSYLQGLPVTADSLAAVAAAQLFNGDPGSAVETLQRAVALDPERVDLQTRLNEARLAQLQSEVP